MRPGCVLLQSAYGHGRNNSFVSQTFDTKHWLVAPTENMAHVSGTVEQWRHLATLLDAGKFPAAKAA